jgi:hypothetical protein
MAIKTRARVAMRRRLSYIARMNPIVIFILFGVVAASIAWFGHMANVKRREAMAAAANKLGLQFQSEKNRQLASSYQFLDKLKQGSNRYAYNIISGMYKGYPVMMFDYHYETHSSDSKGHRRTHHHHFSFFILTLQESFPELKIGPEGFFSKIAQAIGFDDVDFESHEFSRKFCVRSSDKKFAYDFCNARMIEYLLTHPKITIEVEGLSLAVCTSGRIKPEFIQPGLDQLITLRSHMPDYLFPGVT